MLKKYVILTALTLFISLPALAAEPVFSSTGEEVQKINIEPVSSTASETKITDAVNKQSTNTPSLSEENYKNAINSLDSAQVEVRDQLATYKALMEQSKSEYEAQKTQYVNYKKEYKEIEKKLKRNDKIKKMLNESITTPVNTAQ